MKKFKICILLLFIGYVYLSAQNTGRQQLIDNYAVEYLKTVEKRSLLYYGNDQVNYPRTSNHPYLINDQYVKARLSYHNVIYPEAFLRLDLCRNELIILSPEFRNIILFPENVDFVELYGKHIIFFRQDNLPGCPSSGYYNLLYSGKCRILERNSATLTEKTESGRLLRYFDMSTKYYLYKDGIYHQIKNETGLLKILSKYKKELKRFISTNHLQFKRNAEEFLIQTIKEYEKLSGSL